MTNELNQSIECLREAAAKATSELQQLEQEAETLPEKVAKLARSGDGETLIESDRRRAELPSLIFAANVKARRTQIALLAAECQAAQQEALAATQELAREVQPLTDEMEALKKRMLELQFRYDELARSERMATVKAQQINQEISDRSAALEKLIESHLGTSNVPDDDAWSRYSGEELEMLEKMSRFGDVRIDQKDTHQKDTHQEATQSSSRVRF